MSHGTESLYSSRRRINNNPSGTVTVDQSFVLGNQAAAQPESIYNRPAESYRSSWPQHSAARRSNIRLARHRFDQLHCILDNQVLLAIRQAWAWIVNDNTAPSTPAKLVGTPGDRNSVSPASPPRYLNAAAGSAPRHCRRLPTPAPEHCDANPSVG